MELKVFDENFNPVGFIDTAESIIWTDRYNGYGDFEIFTSVNGRFLSTLQRNYYLTYDGSDHAMIIEGLEISTDTENGNKLTVTGRSLESMLDRRIVWTQTILTGNLQNGIKRLLDENAIIPVDPSRQISRLIFEASTDPRITELTVDAQYTGDNLYSVIEGLCYDKSIGFQIILNEDNLFVFRLYSGADRSYEQIENPYVTFSKNFDNLISSNYLETIKMAKTVTLIGGEGFGSDRFMAVVSTGNEVDLARREIFTNAGDVSKTTTDGSLTDEEYISKLADRGIQTLLSNAFVQNFDAQIEARQMYVYGQDFFMGDIVQIENEYGLTGRTRVVKVTHSQGLSGIDIYPTFSKVN